MTWTRTPAGALQTLLLLPGTALAVAASASVLSLTVGAARLASVSSSSAWLDVCSVALVACAHAKRGATSHMLFNNYSATSKRIEQQQVLP